MKKVNTIKLISHTDFKKELLKDARFRKVHEELAFESELIKALIRARVQKKLTQKTLASSIGVAQSALARFESGRINPTLSFLKKVTQGLGLKLTVK